MWLQGNDVFTEDMIPEGAIGFIYEMRAMVNGSEKRYIGKKNFFSDVKTKLAKKDLPTDKRLKTYSRKRKFTYQNYFSSNDVLKQANKDGVVIKRMILKICYSKMELSYEEVRFQMIYDVLRSEMYLNGNVMGKFFKGKI